jgi:hypothetical protein
MTKYTPKEACRKFCTQCLGLKRFDSAEIAGCQGDQAIEDAHLRLSKKEVK